MAFPSSPPPLPGVTHMDVTVRRVRWHVAAAGPEDAPPVVLLHGWPQHWWAWRDVIPLLADDHRVYAPDLRGFGWSEAPDGRYSKMGLACDVVDLLDQLDIESCVLAGHDWGGFVTLLTALREPERVERLVALNIIHPWISVPPPTPLTLLKTSYQWVLSTPVLGAYAQQQPQLLRQVLQRGAPGFGWDERDLDLYTEAFQRPEHARAASALYRTFMTRELPAIAAGRYANRTLEVPGVLATSTGDPVVRPSRLDGYEAHAPNLRTEVIPDAGHFTLDEQPGRVATLIREG